jgi:hypothetical protein
MVEGNKKVHLMNENSKRDFVLNSLASNAPISRQGEKNKRTLLTMKFDTIDVCQNAWFKCYGIKRRHFLPL